MILHDIRQYRKANKDFVDWLTSERIVNNVEAYLKLQDKLSIGVLLEYVHSKGANILIGDTTVSLIKRKKYSPFKATFEHKGLTYIAFYSRQTTIPYNEAMVKIIDMFFEELNRQLLD